MASGFGTTGQVGRCYPLWMDFSKCLQDAESRTACAALREDYIECLHHRKEYNRINVINRERIRAAKAEGAHAKAVFDHKWFGTPMPEGAGHH